MSPFQCRPKYLRPKPSRRTSRQVRRGTTIVESAILLSTLLLVLFVLFDFGLAAFQYNTLSAAARTLARAASVHGSAAAPQLTTWGPAEYAGNAGDGSEIAAAVASLLPTMTTSAVAVDVTWPVGSNTQNDAVQVKLGYTHRSLVPFLPGISSLNMQAESTMFIVH